MAGDTQHFDALEKLMGSNYSLRKATPRQVFAAISLQNTNVVDDILTLSQKLASKKQYKEANELLRIAEKVLENNKRLQNKVGEVLSDGK